MFTKGVLIGCVVMAASAAQAACPQALAVYTDADKTLSLEFTADAGAMATVSNSFRVAMANDIVLDGIVQWGNGVSRPDGMMMHQCPEGDVTGDELRACTIWEGIVYSVAEDGTVGLLPSPEEDAAHQLLLPDFGRFVRYSAIYGDDKVSAVPWDVLTLSGCQE